MSRQAWLEQRIQRLQADNEAMLLLLVQMATTGTSPEIIDIIAEYSTYLSTQTQQITLEAA